MRVTNRSDAIALLVRLKLVHGDGGKQEVLPIFWTDNYFLLLPGEKRELSARFLAAPRRMDDLKTPTAGRSIASTTAAAKVAGTLRVPSLAANGTRSVPAT